MRSNTAERTPSRGAGRTKGSPYELDSPEIVLRAQAAFDLFNNHIVR